MSWKLPGYVVEDLIGYGASGEVWRARVSATSDPVAIKRIAASDPAQVQAARAEAALLSTLEHPHLVRLHELVPTPDAMALVLDLAAGGSLGDLLTQRGRLTAGEVIGALAPIGAALAYAHNEGVIHGDVTPGNVLFTDRGLPLLSDLGVARVMGDAGPARSTAAYIDPSVAAGCAPGAPSDVFMLAAVAFHALTGEPVWPGATPADALARAAAGEIGEVAARLAHVPPELAALVTRGLAIEPHLRCTAAEFALDLRHSGDPLPVELAAGRTGDAAAPVRPYRAAHRADDRDGDEPADPARPAFDRPGSMAAADDVAQIGQLTHSVRAALRPSLPTARRGLRARFPARAVRLAAITAALLAACVVAGLVWSGRHGGAAAEAPQPPAPSSPASTASPAPSAPSAGRATRSAAIRPSAGAPNDTADGEAAHAAQVLIALDHQRELAFAQRRVELLGQVYLPGPLLAQDSALLARVVPTGCQLVGVRTTYSAVRATRETGGRIAVTATAVLAPSTLTCGGTRSASAAGAGPTALRIELAPLGDGYRIASQRKS